MPDTVMLARDFDPAADYSGWLLSEKLNGWRARWDGTRLLSREGNDLHAPPGFLADLPRFPLDGELMHPEGRDACHSAIRTDWAGVTFHAFDIPDMASPYAGRLHVLCELAQSGGRFLIHPHEWLPQGQGEAARRIQERLEEIIRARGEGVMLNDPAGLYTPGRCHRLVKVKPAYDGEALVEGWKPGTGRNAGRVGSLIVREVGDRGVAPFGVAGLRDDERDPEAWPAGTPIRFTYTERSSHGTPVGARIARG